MFKYRGVVFLGAIASLMISGPSPAQAAGQEYLFGGSQLDNGNVAKLGLAGATADGTHFMNGPTYGEYLPSLLGLGFQASNGYAYAGGTSGDGNVLRFALPSYNALGLQQQIDEVAASGIRFQPGDLININAAQDDYLLASVMGESSQADLVAVGDQVGSNLALAVTRLNALGAQHFVVATPLNYYNAPLNGGWSSPAIEAGVDEGVRQTISQLQATQAKTGADIVVYNAYVAFNQFQAHPAAYGFTNITGGCSLDGTCPGDTPSTYLFHDSNHPTTYTNSIIAQQIANLVLAPASAATGVRVSAGLTNLFNRTAEDHFTNEQASTGKLVLSLQVLGGFGSAPQINANDGWVASVDDNINYEGAAVFADYGVSDNLTLSGTVGGVSTHASNALGANYDGNAIDIAGMVDWRPNGWQIDGTGGAVFTNWSGISRPGVDLGDLTGSTNATGEFATVEVSRLFNVDNLAIGPLAGLSYRNTSFDGYSEQGDPLLAYTYDTTRMDGLFGQAGVRFEASPLSNAPSFWLKGDALAEYNFTGSDFTLSSAPQSAPIQRSLTVPADGRASGQIGLEAGWNVRKAVALGITANTSFGGDFGNQQYFSVFLRAHFD